MRISIILCFLSIILTGCSVVKANSKEQNLETYGAASLTVNLNGSIDSTGKSGSVITVASNQVIGAAITLNGPDYSCTSNWSSGQAFAFIFQAMSTGSYTLTVTCWDTDGHTNTSSAVINVQNGYDYSVSVQLGGDVYINTPVAKLTALTWTASPAGLPSPAGCWIATAFGNGVFVAISSDSKTAAYSTDGENWKETSMPSNFNWISVTYGNGMFVAIAYTWSGIPGSAAAYSTDGINWKESPCSMPASAFWGSVAYGDGKFVAIGYGAANGQAAAYSTDGINWIESPTGLPGNQYWYSVSYGNGVFSAISYGSSAAAYSTDGINWTATSMPCNSDWQRVQFGNGIFSAISYNGNQAAYSADGINWIESPTGLPSSSSMWDNITYGNGMFVIIAYEGTGVAYSLDGMNWVMDPYGLPGTSCWIAIAYGNGVFEVIANATTSPSAAAYAQQ